MTVLAAGAALALPATAAADHTYVTKWGSAGSGTGQFNTPGGLDTDSHDNVYVADFGNDRIQKFNSDGDFITQWGTEGTANGEFNEPIDVAVFDDGAGTVAVYVAERAGNRIQKFTASGGFLTKWGGLPIGSGDGQFINPYGVATDSSGNVYVTDQGNNRVQKFDSSGAFLNAFGSSGSGPGQFNSPTGIDVSSGGTPYVYVTDNGNGRVQRWTPAGVPVDSWNGFELGTNASFDSPFDVTVSAETGKVFVVDTDTGNSVEQFDPAGDFETKWNTPGSGNGELTSPQGITTGSLDTFFVTELGNLSVGIAPRVQKFGAPLSGSSVRVVGGATGNRLVFEAADSGSGNDASVTQSGSTFTFTDTDTVIRGAGCQQNGLNSVTCDPVNVTRLRLSVKGGADEVTIASSVSASIETTIDGGADVDTLTGGSGNDTFMGGTAGDFIDGKGGTDTASYADASAGVIVNLDIGTASDGDELTDVENATGGPEADTFTGTAGANAFAGGAGSDTVSYANSATNVTVDLSGGTATGGDTLAGIENVVGSPQDDLITGDAQNNTISCGNGVDGATAQLADTVAPDCENVTRTDQAPADPGGGGGGGVGGGDAGSGSGGTPGAVAPTPRPPVLSGLAVTPMRSGKPGTFSYTLDRAASVTISIERALRGRKVGSRCKKQTRKNRKNRSCTLYTPVGKLTRPSVAGRNALRFSGKLAGRKLAAGIYRATAVATAAAGKSGPATVKFAVRR